MSLNRVLSTSIYLGYVSVAFHVEDTKDALLLSLGFFVVLMIIWFGEIIGEYRGGVSGEGPAIGMTSPGFLVSTVG